MDLQGPTILASVALHNPARPAFASSVVASTAIASPSADPSRPATPELTGTSLDESPIPDPAHSRNGRVIRRASLFSPAPESSRSTGESAAPSSLHRSGQITALPIRYHAPSALGSLFMGRMRDCPMFMMVSALVAEKVA